ncbi:adenylyl-sulfate kinase [Cytobacillus sp. IB215665]|uniref:adenylyl-sulfate kinase n=1 Tax=Cytobacillus sp. IB215665 TaxID=3097357 RepID=UPI002A17923A|nr:adenylyl-sulfate kinase [Cytobacillus sp. IB215665]MDX8365815.1 adenylyl-sulfate kinase [Cytobacillus sp. IB215665]
MSSSKNIVWHETTITRKDRNSLNNHNSCVLWFTGLSGSGKSTLANAVEVKLHESQVRTYVLDGDNIRHGLNKDLGFSEDDRKENIRRIGEVSKLFTDSGQIVLTAFISPFREDRNSVRELFSNHEFIEVYVKCPLEVCETRDPKGLYDKARKGEIPEFTGISSPYEPPEQPELIIESNKMTIEQSVEQVINYLKEKSIVK